MMGRKPLPILQAVKKKLFGGQKTAAHPTDKKK
jgi:hypothetical protein